MTFLVRNLLEQKLTRIALVRCRTLATTNESDQNAAPSKNQDLRQEVINLYKNLIYLSKDWHTDLRPQIKQAFLKNKDVSDEEEIKKLIARGEYVSREITATYHLKKYRAMKRRYYTDDGEKQLDEIFKNYSL